MWVLGIDPGPRSFGRKSVVNCSAISPALQSFFLSKHRLWSLGPELSYAGRQGPVWVPTIFDRMGLEVPEELWPTQRLISLMPLSVTPSGATILGPAGIWSGSSNRTPGSLLSPRPRDTPISQEARCPYTFHMVLEYRAFPHSQVPRV